MILKLIKQLLKRNRNTEEEKIALEESEIFDNLTTQQLQRLLARINYEIKKNEEKEEELRNSDMPF